MNPSVFISYRRDDSEDMTARIHDHLEQLMGAGSVFRDVDNIPLGVRFDEHLEHTLENCAVVLVVIGPRWLNSRLTESQDHLRMEIEHALKRRISIIPIFVRGAGMPARSALPPSIQDLVTWQGTPVRSDRSFRASIEHLAKSIEARLAAQTTPSRQACEIVADIMLTAEEAAQGGPRELVLHYPDEPEPRKLTVRFPAGVKNGGQMRVRGHGRDGGDLVLKLRIAGAPPAVSTAYKSSELLKQAAFATVMSAICLTMIYLYFTDKIHWEYSETHPIKFLALAMLCFLFGIGGLFLAFDLIRRVVTSAPALTLTQTGIENSSAAHGKVILWSEVSKCYTNSKQLIVETTARTLPTQLGNLLAPIAPRAAARARAAMTVPLEELAIEADDLESLVNSYLRVFGANRDQAGRR